ncbi:MAG: pilus assembly protein CpaB [Propionibacteriales bacterium]|nr:pilus assembly protein CpaB [Propionibacteriales bacterium]
MRNVFELRQPLRRFMFRRRRPLAALLVFLALLSALGALRPQVSGDSVVVASRDLVAGDNLLAADLTTISWTGGDAPGGSSSSIADFLGETVASPVRKGEPLTDVRVLGPGLLDGYGPSTVVTTIRIADSAALTGLRSGDAVALIGTDPETAAASVISRDVHLLSTPAADPERADQGVSIQVVTPERDALRLAEVSMDSRLTLVSISQSSDKTR